MPPSNILQAISLRPNALQLRLQLANLQMRTQQLLSAHESDKQAIKLGARQAQTYYLDARALRSLGRASELFCVCLQ